MTTAWRPGQARYLLLALMGATMMAAGWVQLFHGVIRPYLDVESARSWAPASIRQWDAKLFPFHGVMHADFRYTYEFEGRRYTGHRYAFMHPATYLGDEALFPLQRVGPAECFVDSRHPERSVVVRDLPRSAYRFSGVVHALLGLLMTWWALLLYGRPWRPRAPERLRTLGYGTVAGLLGLWGGSLAGFGLAQTPSRAGGVILGTLTLGVAAGLAWRHAAVVTLVIGSSVLSALFILVAMLNPFAYIDVASDTIHEPGLWVDYGATLVGLITLFGSPGAIAAATFDASPPAPPRETAVRPSS